MAVVAEAAPELAVADADRSTADASRSTPSVAFPLIRAVAGEARHD
jgi:hypothetical protein